MVDQGILPAAFSSSMDPVFTRGVSRKAIKKLVVVVGVGAVVVVQYKCTVGFPWDFPKKS